MAVKLSDLTTESAPASTDILLIADPTTGLAKKITVSALKTYMDGLGGGGDATAPTIVSATATAASTIVVVFSENVTVTTAGWSFKKNGVAWAISSVSGSGSTWTFSMATSGVSTDTILRSYDSATGVTVDTASNELASFTDSAVTNSIPAASYQPESDTFFAANTGLTSGEKSAVDNFVIALKAIGWSKFKVVYPFVGGSASAHKWNLINPADTDGAYRAVFNGTITHSSNGITGDGATGYFDTKFNPNTVWSGTPHSCSVFAYNKTNSNGRLVYNYAAAQGHVALLFQSGTNVYGSIGNAQGVVVDTAHSGANGRWIVSRTNSTTLKVFKNGSVLGTATGDASGGQPYGYNVFGLAESNAGGAPSAFGALNLGLFGLADGLSDGDAVALDTAIAAYNTALGR